MNVKRFCRSRGCGRQKKSKKKWVNSKIIQKVPLREVKFDFISFIFNIVQDCNVYRSRNKILDEF